VVVAWGDGAQLLSSRRLGVSGEMAMNLSRRGLLHLVAGTALVPAVPLSARAQAYPARPVHIVVGFPAGFGADITARLMGRWLSERLGQQFVVDNRPGAGGNIGTEAAVRASPDGYSLLFVTQTNAINATLYDRLNFNFIRDVAPVAGIVRLPGVLVVNPAFPARTVPELIAYARANPGKINMASAGSGSFPHVAGELFKLMTGVNMLHVPYRSNPLPDLLSGEVHVEFPPLPASIEYIRSGKLRALAVTTAHRSEVLPDVPTVGEFVAGYESSSWYGVGAPAGTPDEIVERLNREINAGLADPKLKSRLGGVVLPGSRSDFGQLLFDETAKWEKVVRSADIKPD